MLRRKTNFSNIPFHVRRQYPIWYYHFGSQRFHTHLNSWIPYSPDQHLDESNSMTELHFQSKQTISAAILRNKKFYYVTKFRRPGLTMDFHYNSTTNVFFLPTIPIISPFPQISFHCRFIRDIKIYFTSSFDFYTV